MDAEKVLLIYNPNAGNGMFKSNLDMIVGRFQEKGKLVLPIRGAGPELLDRIFPIAKERGVAKVIAAGGDGTINMVANAMLRNGLDLPLAVFPAGTANDFAYYFDIPHDLEGMVDIALEDRYTWADVGRANDRYFVNVAAMGFMVDASQRTDPNIKNTLGIISYYLKGASELPSLRPIRAKIESDGVCLEENIYFMLVMNGNSAGGFRRLAPGAKINDGLLDVLVFREMSILDMGPLLVNVLMGVHEENRNVIAFRTDHLHIEVDQEIGSDVDGEKGPDFPVDIRVVPRALRVNTPHDNMEGSKW